MILTCENCGQSFQSNRSARKYCSRKCANTKAANIRSLKFMEEKIDVVWSSGGGIQSTAIAALICNGALPRPDYAIMVDTGYESERTMSYIRRVVIPNLAKVGVQFELIASSDYGSTAIIDGHGNVNIPAYRENADGSVSKFSTRCNSDWKVRVMRRWLRERGVQRCTNWVGISTDEARRGNKDSGKQWIKNSYPLLELGLSRKDCVDVIKRAGWEMPIRTSCVFCPNRTDFEWLRLMYECPDDFQRACAVEEEIHKTHPNVFLHSSCRPLREVMISE